MKHSILRGLALILCLSSLFAQQPTITVKESDLPPEVLARLKAGQRVQEVTQTLTTGRDWAEMGRAIGIATREGLSAVTTETAKFADTTPGRFTMAVIAWKVAGEDFKSFALSVLVGIPFLIFWLSLYVWWLRKVYGHRYVKKTVIGEGGKPQVTIEHLPPLSLEYPASGSWTKDYAWVPTILPNIFFIAVAFIILGAWIF